MKTRLRRASEADYRAFYGVEPHEGLVGFLAERDGQTIGFGYGWVDPKGRTWVGVRGATDVPPIMLHRKIFQFLRAIRDEGIPEVYALCDERLPRARAWLLRMGFALDATQQDVYTPDVGKDLPVWKRVL